MNSIDFSDLTEVAELEAQLALFAEAKDYLNGFKWCSKVIRGWFSLGIYEKLGVFLMEIEPIGEDVDQFIWVIVGDLPPAYLDQAVETGEEALNIYCRLMEEWSRNVQTGKSIDDCFPVSAEPTIENATLLINRIEFIRENLLDEFNA